MDQELKQRLIGAAVVTALAAIFIPMLFDDPIDDNGQLVSELTIPQAPATSVGDTANKLPASSAQVLNTPETEPLPANPQNPDLEPPLQTVENNEQTAPLAEESEQPLDEAQWIEEIGTEDVSELPVDDTDNDLPEAHSANKPSQDTGVSKSPKAQLQPQPPVAKPSVSEVTGEPKKPASKPSAAKKTESAKTKSGLKRWYLQAGSFSKKENALSRLEALRTQGLPVTLETQTTDKGVLYRLKVGPELDKKRAIGVRDRLNKQNIKSIIVVE